MSITCRFAFIETHFAAVNCLCAGFEMIHNKSAETHNKHSVFVSLSITFKYFSKCLT